MDNATENTGTPIARYSHTIAYDRNDYAFVEHDEDASGNWVQYSDYSTLKAENERLKGDYDAAYSDLQAVRKVSHDRKKSIVTLQAENEEKEKRIAQLEKALLITNEKMDFLYDVAPVTQDYREECRTLRQQNDLLLTPKQ